MVFNAALSLGFESYRTYRMPWVGLPRTRPRVAAADEPGAGTDVYTSWNGATEVATWEIFAGPSVAGLRPVASGPRRGLRDEDHGARACRASCRSRARNAAGQSALDLGADARALAPALTPRPQEGTPQPGKPGGGAA